MAIADFDALTALAATPDSMVWQIKTTTNGVGRGNRWISLWPRALDHVGVVPTTAVAPTSATVGAFPKVNAGSGRQIIVGGVNRVATGTVVNIGVSGTGYAVRPVMIIDRLSHQAGLDADTLGAQTTNLPTAALTRYTSGVGVMAAFENYQNVGPSATQLSMSYTNQAGTAGQTGALNPFVSSEMTGAANCFIPFNLAGGDLGVKSVESVTWSASATDTTANFGITLFKVVGLVWANPDGTFDLMNNAMWNEEILDDACLQMLDFGTAGSSSSIMRALSLGET